MVNRHNQRPPSRIRDRWFEFFFGNPAISILIAGGGFALLFPSITQRLLHKALNAIVAAFYPFAKPLAEIAFAIILLLGAFMLVKSFSKTRSNNPNNHRR